MSEQPTSTHRPINWLIPVIFLSVIVVLALYIVRDNFNNRPPAADYSNKDTRSDYMVPMKEKMTTMPDSTAAGNNSGQDSLVVHRERASMPEADSSR